MKKLICSLKNWWILTFDNPFKVSPGGNCPVQAWGKIGADSFYYFRARGSQWYLKISCGKISTKTQDFSFDEEIFHYGERDYCDWPEAGWLSKRKCVQLATEALKEFYKKR